MGDVIEVNFGGTREVKIPGWIVRIESTDPSGLIKGTFTTEDTPPKRWRWAHTPFHNAPGQPGAIAVEAITPGLPVKAGLPDKRLHPVVWSMVKGVLGGAGKRR